MSDPRRFPLVNQKPVRTYRPSWREIVSAIAIAIAGAYLFAVMAIETANREC